MWKIVSGLLADPETLRLGLEHMIEREKSRASRNPGREATLWASKLEQLERKRSALQDMTAEGLITFKELRGKLELLQKEYARAKTELDAALHRKEKIAALEADAKTLLDSYASAIPGRMRGLDADERHRIYELLKLRAVAQCDGSVELSGALGNIAACVNQTQFHNSGA